MISNLLPFPDSSSLRRGQRGRRLYLTFRRWGLRRLPCTEYEAVDSHGLLDHHFFMRKGVSSWQIDYELLGFHCRSLGFNVVLRVSGFLNGDFMDGFVGQFTRDVGTRTLQIRLVGGLARLSRCSACLDLLLHQW